MLTLYYVSATFLQSWRINKIYQKINEQLAQQATITFYTLPSKSTDGFDAFLATSELCVNRNAAKISEILWLKNNHRGCCLQPLQSIPVTPWITFPDAPSLLPFAYEKTPELVIKDLEYNNKDLLRLLLETEIEQGAINDSNTDVVKLENYGKLIAWKIDSHLAVLIETNVQHFTKFLINTFLQNNFLINDQLTLLRIESVQDDGKPQPFAMVSSHMRKPTRVMLNLDRSDWCRHLEDLKSLCVLANQATEYVYNKNRTEGKTGPIKPDVVPQVQISQEKQFEQNKKLVEDVKETKIEEKVGNSEENVATNVEKTNVLVNKPRGETAETDRRQELTKKDENKEKTSKLVVKDDIKTSTPAQQVELENVPKSEEKILEEPIKTVVTTPSKESTAADKASTSSKSPSKMKAKPTELKKVGTILDTQRFKTIKVSEPLKQTASELEKIAAAKVAAKTQSKETTTMLATPETQQKRSSISKLTRDRSKSKSPADREIPISSTSSTTPQKQHQQQTKSTETVSNVKKTAVTVQSTVPPPPVPANTCSTTDTAETATKKPQTASVDISSDNSSGKRSSLKRHKDAHTLKECKPPNVLIYAESTATRQSANEVLRNLLAENTYTIYNLTSDIVQGKTWADTTALLVVCGSVPTTVGEIIVDYFLRGGKVLSLCSDILHFILPNYRTAEVREHELVQFSYDKWHKVKMMHHIFCYQPSPVRKNFSTESDEGTAANSNSKKSALVCLPRSIELMDLQGHTHHLNVEVLGTEETWNTPSLLLAQNCKNSGTAVFSQVHLEINPSEFEADENKYPILKQNEAIRHEIFADLLKSHLGLNVRVEDALNGSTTGTIFQNAYFLGRYEEKSLLLEKLKEKSDKNQLIQTPNITLKFCGPGETLPQPKNDMLPILIHSCPDDFSTVEYFDNLKTKYVGRLVIYAPVISSSQHIVRDLDLTNGIVVMARQQTNGIGRDKNQWLSPPGCVMFSLQLHVPLATPLGKRLSLIQHIIAAAVVNALRGHDLYKHLDVGLKWPNDIYAFGINKIGGLCLHSFITEEAIVSAGCGLNLDNDKPTVCINDMIRDYNKSHKQQPIPLLKYELLLALIFNEIEQLLEMVKSGDFDSFYKLYYSLWLHSNQTVTICDGKGMKREAKVIGIDDNGYLQVRLENGIIDTVFPDGNSFDMLKGLIIPKVY